MSMVLEVDQIDILARSVFCHFQQIDYAQKTGASRQFGRHLRERDAPERGHLDEPTAQAVTSANLHVRPAPDSYAAGDLAAHDWFAQPLGKGHRRSLRFFRRTCGDPSLLTFS